MQESGHEQYCISAGSSEVAVGFFSRFVPFFVYNLPQLLYAHSYFSPLRISLWASLVVQW